MHKPVTENIIFRIIFPIIFGLFAYLVVLMVFDSVFLIIENFFSKEIAFFIILSFTIFELLRFVFKFIDEKQFFKNKEHFKLSLLVLLSILISLITVSVFVNLYFRIIENTDVFSIELIVFSFIMVFASLLYLAVFYSISLIAKQAKQAINIEIIEKENINRRLRLLQTKTRPEILYESLEILINLIHKDEKTAEEFINKLSSFYRNIIEERHTETISIKQEILATEKLISLLNNKYDGNIKLQNSINCDFQIIPGIIQQLVFIGVQKNIITEFLPFKIELETDNEYLIVNYKCHKRLILENKLSETISELLNKYKIYSNKRITETKDEYNYRIKIPMLIMETI